MKNIYTLILGLLLVAAAWGTTLLGQGGATLTGTVEDGSGAVIPGATVTLTEAASGTKRSKVSTAQGFISFVGIPAATYNVEVAAPGFRPLRQTGVAVHINDQLELKGLTLMVATNEVSVTVTTENADLTPTTSGEQAYTISSKQIENLNIQSRSALELLDLIPGAANTGNFTGTYNREQSGFGQNSSTYTVNGNRFDQVQIVSDGAPVTDLNTAGAAAVTPNVDMISEAKVETSAFSSVQPNGPVVFETQTKSGGNHFHGEGYLTARNHVFDSTDARNKLAGLPKANSSFYYPGFNVGGPVLLPSNGFNRNRDKLFFFAAAEFTQQHVDLSPQFAVVPTAAERVGDFSDTALLSSLSGLHYYESVQPCPKGAASGSYCTGPGMISPSAIDPGARILLNALPLPNASVATTGGYNYVSDIVTSDPRNQENLKLDYNLNDRTHLSGRFNHENENVPSPYGPYNTINFNHLPYPAGQVGRNASNSLNVNLVNTITPSLTNDLTVAYTRLNLRIDFGNTSAVSRTATNYPYPNTFPGSDLLPNLSFQDTDGLYIPGGEAPPFSTIQNTTTVSEGITKTLHKHLLRIGFYDVYATYNNQTTGNDNGTVDERANITGTTGNEYADLLIGNIAGFGQSSKNVMASLANKRFDFYAQDTWKVSSRLTFNYGARLNHIAWWYDKKGQISVFNPAAYDGSAKFNAYTGLQSHATNSAIPLSGAKSLGFQFAPSLGFAYDLDGHGNTIVRGGFGTNYYVDPGINAFSAVGSPPNLQYFSYYGGYGSSPYTLASASKVDLTSTPATVYGTANPNDHQAPVTYSWNFAVAHVFPGAIHLETSYVGNTTRHLNGYSAINLVPEGSETIAKNGGPYYGTYYQQLARPYKSYGDIGINLHNLDSNYNALQVSASRSKGWFNTWVTYTYGKALAYNCENPFHEHDCYGPAGFDRSQQLNVSYYIILPRVSEKYMGNHKLANEALDGWQISGIEQYGTGSPFTDVAQGGSLHSEYGGNQVIGIYGSYLTPGGVTVPISNESVNGTPDEDAVPVVTCDPRKGLKAHQYFNPSCFGAPSEGHNGTFRLPYIHGPNYFNDELGIFKDFKVRETGKLQIRFQSFNFLNRKFDNYMQYAGPLYLGFNALNATPTNAATTGLATGIGHRSFQAAAKYYF